MSITSFNCGLIICRRKPQALHMRSTMETMGFVFGMSGLSFGLIGFIYGINAMNKISALEKKLREKGILDDES